MVTVYAGLGDHLDGEDGVFDAIAIRLHVANHEHVQSDLIGGKVYEAFKTLDIDLGNDWWIVM